MLNKSLDRRLWRKITPAVTAAALFFVLAALYLSLSHELYVRIVSAWGFQAWVFPFLDTDTVLSALRCLRRGVDVFVQNPCDPLWRTYDYSPLWLTAAVLPVTGDWLTPVGLAVDLGFLLSLLLLPVGRSARDTILITVAVVSTAVVYATERGNNDLVIFVLAACMASLLGRSRAARLFGYGLALLAGVLKYYPMLLMAAALRERPRLFLAITAASILVLAAFVYVAGHDLRRALALIPTGPYLSDRFGAKNLPGGLAALNHVSDGLVPVCQIALTLYVVGLGLRLGWEPTLRADLAALTDPERAFLLTGALLIIGCFLTAQNIGYRAVHLVLLLPGLTALWRARPLYRVSTIAVLFLLWSEGFRHWLDGVLALGGISGYKLRQLFWIVREITWWCLVTLLLAVTVGILLQTEMVRSLQARLAGRGQERSAQ